MQEYFVYFKFLQRRVGVKWQQAAAGGIVRCCLKFLAHEKRLSAKESREPVRCPPHISTFLSRPAIRWFATLIFSSWSSVRSSSLYTRSITPL